MDSENRDLRKPVTLAVAAEVLAERYPEYAFTARQLRQFVQMGKLPYLPIECENERVRGRMRRNGERPTQIFVRVAQLVDAFKRMEKRFV